MRNKNSVFLRKQFSILKKIRPHLKAYHGAAFVNHCIITIQHMELMQKCCPQVPTTCMCWVWCYIYRMVWLVFNRWSFGLGKDYFGSQKSKYHSILLYEMWNSCAQVISQTLTNGNSKTEIWQETEEDGKKEGVGMERSKASTTA